MATGLSDKEFLASLEKLTDFDTTQVIDPKELCKRYQENRKLIEAIIPYISKIPVYGPKISGIISNLMKIADALCPA